MHAPNAIGQFTLPTFLFQIGHEFRPVTRGDIGRNPEDGLAIVLCSVIGPAIELLEDVIGKRVHIGRRHFIDRKRRPRAQIRRHMHSQLLRRLTPAKPEGQNHHELETDYHPQRTQVGADVIDLGAVTSHTLFSRYPKRHCAE